jgi:hypothetical protein
MSTTLTPKNLEIANEILQWARDFLMPENKSTRRPVGSQSVCPFVRASVENNSFYMEFHDEVTGQSEEQIERIMLECIRRFGRLGPYGDSDKLKKALLVVFPNLPETQANVLDLVHTNIKNEFVQNGMMVGQFHPRCEERGLYNPAFKVSVCKYPLIAMRHMALHDILFLGHNQEWFNCYNLRFGHRFNQPENIEDYNKHLVRFYEEAKRKFLTSGTPRLPVELSKAFR